MKPQIFVYIALLAAVSPALSAPAEKPQAPKSEVSVPQIDRRVVKLLDQSVAAYKNLDALSQDFERASYVDGKVQSQFSFRGTMALRMPYDGRIEYLVGDEKRLFVVNENQMDVQIGESSYLHEQDEEEDFFYAAISPLSEPLSYLITGDNTLDPASGFGWKTAKLSPAFGYDGVTLTQNFVPVTHRIYFDTATHLVRRIESETIEPVKADGPGRVTLNIVTLTPNDTVVTPEMFRYVPPVGAKLMTGEAEPDFYDKRLIVGAQPFALADKTLKGAAISLDDYRGKVVLLDFWATWCKPCLEEIPSILHNYNKYHAQGFEVIAISADTDEAALRAYVEKHDLPWPQIYGPDRNTVTTYGVRAFPTSFLIGKDGTIAAVNPTGDYLEPAIEAALAK